MGRSFGFIAVLSVTGVGCVFDASIDPGARLTCDDGDDCPTGTTCDGLLERCIGSAPADPRPVTITVQPPVVARGSNARVGVIADAESVEVFARRPSGAVKLERSGSVFTYLAQPDDVSGALPIVAVVTFTDGTVVEQSAITLDVDAPTAVVTPERRVGNLTEPARIVVRASEPVTLTGFNLDAVPLVFDGNGSGVVTITLGSSLGDGTYNVGELVMTDAPGNVASLLVDVNLAVDRTPPTFTAAPSFVQAIHSAQPDFNRADVSFIVLDASSVVATLGGTALPCTVGVFGEPTRCAGELNGTEPEVVGLFVRATDVAGNVSEVLGATVTDFLPPTIDSVGVFIAPPFGSLLPYTIVATLGSVVHVNMSAVDVGQAGMASASVALVDGSGANAVSASVPVAPNGDALSLALPINEPLPVADYPLLLSAVDAVGNTTAVQVGVVSVGDTILAPCVARQLDGTAVCTDFDDDGAFGAAGGCGTATDCDDTNPIAYPGAKEIPGNLVDDDCANGDTPLDDSAGVFVDASANPVGAAGTMAAPFSSLLDVASDVSGARIVYLRGDFDLSAPLDYPGSVIGGFDDLWRPSTQHSTIRASNGPTTITLVGDEVVFARVALRDCAVIEAEDGDIRIVDVDIEASSGCDPAIGVDEADTLVAGSTVSIALNADPTALYAGSTNAQIRVIDSTLIAEGTAPLTRAIFVDASLSVIRSRLRAFTTNGVAEGINAGRDTLVLSTTVEVIGGDAMGIRATTPQIAHVSVDVDGGDGMGTGIATGAVGAIRSSRVRAAGAFNAEGLHVVPGTTLADIRVDAACAACFAAGTFDSCDPGCAAAGVTAASPLYQGQCAPLAEPEPFCPADTAFGPSMIDFGLPTAAAADARGTCRGANGDVGAIESP